MTDAEDIRAEGLRRFRERMSYASTHDGSAHKSHLLGLVGEYLFAERYGFEVDMNDRPSGDGGADFTVTGPNGMTYRINVQTRINRSVLDVCVPEGKTGRADMHVLLAVNKDDSEVGYSVVDAWWVFEPDILTYCPNPQPPLKPGMQRAHMLPTAMAHRLAGSLMDQWLKDSHQIR